MLLKAGKSELERFREWQDQLLAQPTIIDPKPKNPNGQLHTFKILPNHSVSYWLYDRRGRSNISGLARTAQPKKAVLSTKAQKNLRNCFNWFNLISNKKTVYSKKENKTFTFRFSFITLTLSDVQKHPDDYIKKHMLEPFLKWMYRSWHCNSYIWKAEVQNNGNIHFHITTNKFIHWKSVRTKWNRLLAAHGYCKVFQDGSNDKGDSATEIRAVKNDKEISKYIAAYVSKKDVFKSKKNHEKKKKEFIESITCELNNHFYMKENYRQIQCSDGAVREYKRIVNGRSWGASVNLNQSGVFITHMDEEYRKLSWILNHPQLCDVKEFDFSKVYIYKQKIFRYLPSDVKDKFKSIVTKMIDEDEPQKKIVVETLY